MLGSKQEAVEKYGRAPRKGYTRYGVTHRTRCRELQSMMQFLAAPLQITGEICGYKAEGDPLVSVLVRETLLPRRQRCRGSEAGTTRVLVPLSVLRMSAYVTSVLGLEPRPPKKGERWFPSVPENSDAAKAITSAAEDGTLELVVPSIRSLESMLHLQGLLYADHKFPVVVRGRDVALPVGLEVYIQDSGKRLVLEEACRKPEIRHVIACADMMGFEPLFNLLAFCYVATRTSSASYEKATGRPPRHREAYRVGDTIDSLGRGPSVSLSE